MGTFESRLREPEGSKAIIIRRVALNLAEQHEAEKDVETRNWQSDLKLMSSRDGTPC